MGCTSRLVAHNKRELVICNNTKKPKNSNTTNIKIINLLSQSEFIFLERIFFSWTAFPPKGGSTSKACKISKNSTNSSLTKLQQDVFIFKTQLLAYGIHNNYTNLNVKTFLSEWDYDLDQLDIIPRTAMHNQAVLISIKLLVYGCLAILNQRHVCSKNKKVQNFLLFLLQLKKHLSQNWGSFASTSKDGGKKTKKCKIFYTYRLTFQESENTTKQYYMGYRGCSTHPNYDKYYSSSAAVKELKTKHGLNCFKKKILGIYLTQQEALATEVRYHATLQVDTNKLFLNRAKQTTTSFVYDNTGTTQSAESNQKRSIALKDRKKFTPEGLKKVSESQLARERTESEIEAIRERAVLRNSQKIVCPYCNQEGQAPAMRRWHFENCKQAPNPSEKGIEQRKELSERFQNLNERNGRKLVEPEKNTEKKTE